MKLKGRFSKYAKHMSSETMPLEFIETGLSEVGPVR